MNKLSQITMLIDPPNQTQTRWQYLIPSLSCRAFAPESQMGPLLGLARAIRGPVRVTYFQTFRSYQLDGCNQDVQAIARSLAKDASNVVVMTGAGVSTPSGIPDFRTPGSGIYDNLKQYRLPYPEAIFDISYFRQSPDAFNTWAKEFFPGLRYQPNLAHFFIKLLHDKGKLVRLYTQNIDGLEVLTGLPHEQVVHAHGSFTGASCVACGRVADLEDYKANILLNQNPRCSCSEKAPIKPDIVFFGENLPERFQMFQEDTAFSDFLICMGTSLEVYPFAGIADAVPRKVPRLLINRTLVGSFGSREEDCILLGDLVEQVIQLCRALGWEQDLFDLKNAYDKKNKLGNKELP